ncbi:MAG TPA: PmoA family protein [Candidatus Paceibacterota bacterium]|nr:PmoA family protein [Verrucomicrobiota bacterium]HRZ44799.1 PmoA family protein [Candidatus Paceibacterota bacterium]
MRTKAYLIRPDSLLICVLGWGIGWASMAGAPAVRLPGTEPIVWEEADLSGRMMDGAHQFVERQIAASAAQRGAFWARDFSSAEAYARSVEPNRDRFRAIVGAVDPRLPVRMERFGDEKHPALVAETSRYRVFQVRWPVLEGLWGEGLLVEPTGQRRACGVVIPDASQTPEQVLGLAPGVRPASQVARRLAEQGIELVIPATVNRDKLQTQDKQIAASDQTHREWIYRQAFHMGRHVIGYEVQTVLAAVDWFQSRVGAGAKTAVCGYGEGGLAALYAAALDGRIDAALVSGYFDSRQNVWAEPIYRNVWGLLREFGDAEIASLILPRILVIEHSAIPEVTGHKGDLRTPSFASVRAEIERIQTGGRFSRPVLVHGEGSQPTGPYSEEALAALAQRMGMGALAPVSDELLADRRVGFDPAARHQRLFQAMENHVQTLVRRSEHVRDQFFLYQVMPELADNRWSTERRRPTHPPEEFIEGAKAFRRQFQEEGMGRFDEPLLPFNARSRKVAESARWTAYDVVLDVWPKVFAWGVLAVPNDIRPGERRPVVVCQHGRNGLPRDTLDASSTAYNNFAGVLADRGFVTFAPHNLYRGEDRYRWLDRKANTVRATLFSFIIAQHDQILRWLEAQPFVDGGRIAFYGLSYGGETAVRVPAILEKYCLSICSGDFNQWTRKVAATDQPFSFMRTIEWEMPYWNLGHTFDYAEMGYLMAPRPFMVERGHLDRVGRDQWVAHEYAKVRWLYAQLGLADRTAIEFFQGRHSINGEGTFDFLQRHLNLPAAMRISQDSSTGRIEITEGGKPVLRYNYGTVEPGAVLEKVTPANRIYARARSGYIHPLYGPNGEVLTADWSLDHPHHRGIYWAWPEVDFGGERGDLHALQKVFARPTGKVQLESGPAFAQIEAENLWLWEDREPIVRERAVIRAYPATPQGRAVDLTLEFLGLKDGVTIARRGTDQYGGLNVRMATPKAQVITMITGASNAVPRRAWSDLSGRFAGSDAPSGLAIFQHAQNPDYPGDWVQFPELSWCQPTFPASGRRFALERERPLILRFRLWIHPGSRPEDDCAERVWDSFGG